MKPLKLGVFSDPTSLLSQVLSNKKSAHTRLLSPQANQSKNTEVTSSRLRKGPMTRSHHVAFAPNTTSFISHPEDKQIRLSSPQISESPKNIRQYMTHSQNFHSTPNSNGSLHNRDKQFTFARMIEDPEEDFDAIKESFLKLKGIIETTKSPNVHAVIKWNNDLIDKCQKLIGIQSKNTLREKLQEEQKNRLRLEEQTNRMLTAQEAEIKRLTDKITYLEQQLIYK